MSLRLFRRTWAAQRLKLVAVSVGLLVPQYVAPGQQKVPPVAPTDIIRQGRANTLVEHW